MRTNRRGTLDVPFALFVINQRARSTMAGMKEKERRFETVRKVGLEFSGVEESTMYGSPALKVRGKLLACIPSHRSAEAGSLVVCVDFADRAALLAEAPEIYYITEHYISYPSVLVRLSRVTPDVLRGLLGMAYKFATSKAAQGARARSRKKAASRE